MASNSAMLKILGGILLVFAMLYAYKYQAGSKEKIIAELRESNKKLSMKKDVNKKRINPIQKKIKKVKQRKKQLQQVLEAIKNDDNKASRRVQLTSKTKTPHALVSKNTTKKIKPQKEKKKKTKTVIPEKEQDKMLQSFFKDRKKKVILSYTKVFGDKYWYDVDRVAPFVERDGSLCKFRHCKIKYSRNLITKADAVLFHAPELPPVKELKSLKIPEKQIWIWMTSESPYYYQKSKISFKDYHHVFNWTGTYRTDSKIWTPFYVIKPLKQSDPKPDINKDYAQGKSKTVSYTHLTLPTICSV